MHQIQNSWLCVIGFDNGFDGFGISFDIVLLLMEFVLGLVLDQNQNCWFWNTRKKIDSGNIFRVKKRQGEAV